MAVDPNAPVLAPTEADLDQQVGALSAQTGIGSNLASAPKGLNSWQLQTWNVGQIAQQLAAKYGSSGVTSAAIVARAQAMYAGYAALTPEQQQIANEMANVSLMMESYGQKAGVNVFTQQPGGLPSPALDAQIRTQFGYEAWMLDIPELRAILERSTIERWDPARLQAALEATNWWRTTSLTQRSFYELQANNPGELQFNNAGSQAAQAMAKVQAAAAASGVTVDTTTMQQMALNAIEFGWSDQQLKQAIGSQAMYNPAGGVNNAAGVANQLKAAAAQYFQGEPSQPTMQQWVQGISGGTQTIDQFNAQMQAAAASRWQWAAPLLAEGSTMQQITDPIRQRASQLMEVTPAQIDFINNPTYSKILDYVAPGDTVHRMMTDSEASTYLRNLPQWGYTQQARDAVGTQANSILKTFGVVAQ